MAELEAYIRQSSSGAVGARLSIGHRLRDDARVLGGAKVVDQLANNMLANFSFKLPESYEKFLGVGDIPESLKFVTNFELPESLKFLGGFELPAAYKSLIESAGQVTASSFTTGLNLGNMNNNDLRSKLGVPSNSDYLGLFDTTNLVQRSCRVRVVVPRAQRRCADLAASFSRVPVPKQIR